MGVARSIEERLEGLVEGFFAKVFRSGLQPVEVGRKILREMAENKTVSVNRTYVPNEFRVHMGSDDFGRFRQMEAALAREFGELVIDEAKRNRWNLMGLPRISLVEKEGLGQGQFSVEAALAADADVRAPGVSTHEPKEGDPAATHAVSSETADRLKLHASGARLVVLDEHGEAAKEKISITRAPVVIGRISSTDVVLADPNVSRRHAELRRDGGRWVLVDLGSTNGTLVNGKLAMEHELRDGDRLSFGKTQLRFELGPGSGTDA
ncbi:MAG: FhaA domain-containing protein [Actinomycetota bacterium]